MGTWGNIIYGRLIADKQGFRLEKYIQHYPTPSFYPKCEESELIKKGFEPDKQIIVDVLWYKRNT